MKEYCDMINQIPASDDDDDLKFILVDLTF